MGYVRPVVLEEKKQHYPGDFLSEYLRTMTFHHGQ